MSMGKGCFVNKILIKNEISDDFVGLSKMSARDIVNTLGIDAFANAVAYILQGGNVRQFTEILTRTRLIQSYKELLDFFG